MPADRQTGEAEGRQGQTAAHVLLHAWCTDMEVLQGMQGSSSANAAAAAGAGAHLLLFPARVTLEIFATAWLKQACQLERVFTHEILVFAVHSSSRSVRAQI